MYNMVWDKSRHLVLILFLIFKRFFLLTIYSRGLYLTHSSERGADQQKPQNWATAKDETKDPDLRRTAQKRSKLVKNWRV